MQHGSITLKKQKRPRGSQWILNMALRSNLDLVNESDNFPYYADDPDKFKALGNGYYHFYLEGCGACLGYMTASVVERMPLTRHWRLDKADRRLVFQPRDDQGNPVVDLDTRSHILAGYLQDVRERRLFGVLDGWRSEQYPIYGPQRELVLSMERSATPLFGVVTYGVHMTGYVETEQGIKIWAPRRALTKPTYPGMMDNTVAGGLSTGEKPFDCLVRECDEEASLPADLVRAAAQACGTLTYFHVRDARAGGETGLCQPECQYIYDLKIPPDVIPKPGDDEAIDFQLLTVQEVRQAMAEADSSRTAPICSWNSSSGTDS
ncbi:NUDIX domain-containing protein [Cladophialophora immunda]|nr:NUDIX domain-containing protein [Cladophialophora immunda]